MPSDPKANPDVLHVDGPTRDAMREALERIASMEPCEGIDGKLCWSWLVRDLRVIAREALGTDQSQSDRTSDEATPAEPVYEWRAISDVAVDTLGRIHAREVAQWFLSLPLTRRRRTYLERRTPGIAPAPGSGLTMEGDGMIANTRDASFIRCPRHDGVGGHRPGSWSPCWHVVIDHPTKGGSWSACGKAFLIEGGQPAADIPTYSRCGLNGCRQRFIEADRRAKEGRRDG